MQVVPVVSTRSPSTWSAPRRSAAAGASPTVRDAATMPNENRIGLPPELDYKLDRLLEDWWLYERDYRGAPASLHAHGMFRHVKTPNLEDSTAEGALAESVDPATMSAVESSVCSLSADHQHAIDVRMMNSLTRAVWRSNRIGDRVEILYVEAKVMLLPMLRKRRVEI